MVAATLNSAYALNVHDKVGSIEVGKIADLVILDIESWVYIMYSFGDSFITKVIKAGIPLWFIKIKYIYLLYLFYWCSLITVNIVPIIFGIKTNNSCSIFKL